MKVAFVLEYFHNDKKNRQVLVTGKKVNVVLQKKESTAACEWHHKTGNFNPFSSFVAQKTPICKLCWRAVAFKDSLTTNLFSPSAH